MARCRLNDNGISEMKEEIEKTVTAEDKREWEMKCAVHLVRWPFSVLINFGSAIFPFFVLSFVVFDWNFSCSDPVFFMSINLDGLNGLYAYPLAFMPSRAMAESIISSCNPYDISNDKYPTSLNFGANMWYLFCICTLWFFLLSDFFLEWIPFHHFAIGARAPVCSFFHLICACTALKAIFIDLCAFVSRHHNWNIRWMRCESCLTEE